VTPEEHGHRFLPGSECLIEALGDDSAVSQRLSEMGVLPGSRLQVIRVSLTAPLRVRALLGGRGFRERMQQKQIVPGQSLQILESTPHRVRVVPDHTGVPVELGAGEAVKIIVEPVLETTGR